ncbi:uncharacterized protein LOC125764501 [Anopheles funestus]|uniref:uncharacterized protein LOC125764501 n=1 Tax=Anopheles funestus TaxID=62324 RepID=UPI0020C6EFC4|nr:uncharacterized protein LOC125764501 [Anopheles funestus]
MSEESRIKVKSTRLERPVKASIGGIGGTLSSARHEITTIIESTCGSFKTVLDFTVLTKVTHEIPSIPYTNLVWPIPPQLQLADPHYNIPGRIDMIIGAGIFYKLLKGGRFNIPNSNISLVETVFGWIVTGLATKTDSSDSPNVTCNMTTVADIQQQLQKFWQIEEVEERTILTSDEKRCEQYYNKTTVRDNLGRYMVKLPKHPDWEQMIGHSKSTALRRFASLEKKLEGNEQLRVQYNTFMEEYISLGHMSLATNDSDSSTNYFLPHHPVIKEASTTTKLRVVFDGSAVTTTGKSLNDALLVGPVVQDDLLNLVIRFRKFPVVLIADIEKMYRQVLVHPDDRSLQQILWRFSKDEPIQSYKLNTVTYGLAPSSYLATRTLLKLAEDEGEAFPLAAHAIKNQLYVDDLIAGADDVAGAIQLRDELNALLEKGGFKFRKWCSNLLPVLDGLSPELLGTKSSKCFDIDETINTLGIRWEPQADRFGFSVPDNIKAEPYTKRNILSAIAKLYDPLGLIAPVIVQAKILMQSLWVVASDWDEEIPDHLQKMHPRLRTGPVFTSEPKTATAMFQ